MKVICQQCKGKGAHFVKLKQSKSTPWKFAPQDGCAVEHYVSCMNPGCENGIIDTEKQFQILWGKNHC